MSTRVRSFLGRVKRHISSIAFFCGFVWDTLTLTRIDLVYENVVFISYLCIAFLGILLVHSVETGKWAPRVLASRKEWLPALVQFPLGGLFSGFVIFYTKSASLFTSWPFLTILLLLFIGNEFFRRRYERLVFQISVFYFCLLSYLVLITPVVLGTMGVSTFVLATIVSLFVLALFLQVVMRIFPELYMRSMRGIWLVVFGIFVSFHALYFTNTIPPVPLSLKEIGVYHQVTRAEQGYLVSYEEPGRFEFWRSTARTFHRAPQESVYCFSAVFAPTRLRTNIYHSWQRKTEGGAWVRDSYIGFSLVGGRDEGYRGYTMKSNISDGEWRCVVETEGGKVVGETYFSVQTVTTPVRLRDAVR